MNSPIAVRVIGTMRNEPIDWSALPAPRKNAIMIAVIIVVRVERFFIPKKSGTKATPLAEKS
ncbi:hypothetical protein [Leuconostoc mesenteroides]|uniref:hypothetical protein n=1 Tax=Leuconostoc mesenteroides TaxID=1245 RepID=UPI003EBD8E62